MLCVYIVFDIHIKCKFVIFIYICGSIKPCKVISSCVKNDQCYYKSQKNTLSNFTHCVKSYKTMQTNNCTQHIITYAILYFLFFLLSILGSRQSLWKWNWFNKAKKQKKRGEKKKVKGQMVSMRK